jgi:16S rRNA (guanine527-N7)-methyltransferase
MVNDILENVSRETLAHLRQFEEIVLKWTKKINLISSGDSLHIWNRHILDSVQVYNISDQSGNWLDIGSGGGFPGIIMAILAREDCPEQKFFLVDSDERKCAFLRTVSRELGLNVQVFPERAENLSPMNASVLSARALGDLNSLLFHVERHLASTGVALLPKGIRWEQEHEVAQKLWSYDLEVIRSKTNADATILKIKELTRV